MNVRTARITDTVTIPLTTVHLPPERAVLTTPGMVGLMERCIAAAETESGWLSRSVEVRHRAGIKTGERLELVAELAEPGRPLATWRVTATATNGTLIGEATFVRVRERPS